MTGNWEQLLVREGLGADLVAELAPHCTKAEVAALSATVASKADLKALSAAAAKVAKRKLVPAHLKEALQDAIAEIVEDHRWIGTKRSRYTLALNRWQESFFREWRAIPEFAGVYIGGHVAKEVVFVAGFVRSEADKKRALAWVAAMDPPFPLLEKIVVGPPPP